MHCPTCCIDKSEGPITCPDCGATLVREGVKSSLLASRITNPKDLAPILVEMETARQGIGETGKRKGLTTENAESTEDGRDEEMPR